MKYPIYITGSPRSGTSVTLRAIAEATGLSYFNEGIACGLLSSVDSSISKYYNNFDYTNKNYLISKLDIDDLKKDIFDIIKKRIENIFQGQDVWIDKTANLWGVKSVRIIKDIWPESKIIFLKRRPIETIVSRIKKFQKIDFYTHVEQWSEIMKTWLSISESMSEEIDYIVIEQSDISLNTDTVSMQISRYLDLNNNQRKILEKYFKENRPEWSGGNENKFLTLSDTDWSDEEKSFFLEKCKDISFKLGYFYE